MYTNGRSAFRTDSFKFYRPRWKVYSSFIQSSVFACCVVGPLVHYVLVLDLSEQSIDTLITKLWLLNHTSISIYFVMMQMQSLLYPEL